MSSSVGGLSSGKVVVGRGAARQGWWLVADEADGGVRVLAGPFSERAEAGLAAGPEQDGGRPVFGARRADGGFTRRPSPQDWAWLAHLGGQLDRLPEDWDADLPDDDPLTTAVVEVAAALSEAGLPVHDADGPDSVHGGACLIPDQDLGGVVVSWRQHDRMSVDQVHGATADALVQQVMNRALADVLRARGFEVDVLAGAHLVRTAD
ncbi:hypothetical protein [Geodermatophilus sp. CPCC 206100]|uniref:hypothetical protein n=1 Tax=Geodermatophilus sp. CPCC 206100 TaxID=3020054 RepID=UPI003AFFBAB2